MKIVPVEPIGVEIFWDNIKPLVKKAVHIIQVVDIQLDSTKSIYVTTRSNGFMVIVFKDC